MRTDSILTKTEIVTLLLLTVLTAHSALTKPLPEHWGRPPEIQTQDYVELPDGYGHGSSTLKHWIGQNLERDRALEANPWRTVYTNDFETAALDSVPDGLMVLAGDFLVKREGTNQFLELPGAPLDTFAAQFGPGAKDMIGASARVFATKRGRRTPTFGIGLGGVTGWQLQVAPAKNAIELLQNQTVHASVDYEWKADTWTELRLEIHRTGEGSWRIDGLVSTPGEPESKATRISTETQDAPPSGRASVMGSPFSGTPIRYDNLRVDRVPDR